MNKISLEFDHGVGFIRVRGDIDLRSRGQLSDTFRAVAERGIERVILEIDHHAVIDSSGLHAIEGALAELERRNGELVVVARNRGTRRTLLACGLASERTLFEDREAAMQAVTTRGLAPRGWSATGTMARQLSLPLPWR